MDWAGTEEGQILGEGAWSKFDTCNFYHGYWIHLKYPTESDTADVIQVAEYLSHSKGKVGPISCTVL